MKFKEKNTMKERNTTKERNTIKERKAVGGHKRLTDRNREKEDNKTPENSRTRVKKQEIDLRKSIETRRGMIGKLMKVKKMPDSSTKNIFGSSNRPMVSSRWNRPQLRVGQVRRISLSINQQEWFGLYSGRTVWRIRPFCSKRPGWASSMTPTSKEWSRYKRNSWLPIQTHLNTRAWQKCRKTEQIRPHTSLLLEHTNARKRNRFLKMLAMKTLRPTFARSIPAICERMSPTKIHLLARPITPQRSASTRDQSRTHTMSRRWPGTSKASMMSYKPARVPRMLLGGSLS